MVLAPWPAAGAAGPVVFVAQWQSVCSYVALAGKISGGGGGAEHAPRIFVAYGSGQYHGNPAIDCCALCAAVGVTAL